MLRQCGLQARRQGLVAGGAKNQKEGPKRGAKNQKGRSHFKNTILDVMQQQGDQTLNGRAPISDGGAGHH